MHPNPNYLRKCKDCGLEAHTEEDLNLFKYGKNSPHQRANLCKECFNKWRIAHLKKSDETYLLGLFRDMKRRCLDPRRRDYPRYGGRGITVCQEWLSHPAKFAEWAKSNGWMRRLSIERIDNDGPYSPGNCKWIPLGQQILNQRRKSNAVTFPEKRTRICSECKIEKSWEEFSKNKRIPNGRRYTCKKCENKYAKEKRLHKIITIETSEVLGVNQLLG